MERGEGSNQVPIDAIPLCSLGPAFVQAQGQTHFQLVPAKEDKQNTTHDVSPLEPAKPAFTLLSFLAPPPGFPPRPTLAIPALAAVAHAALDVGPGNVVVKRGRGRPNRSKPSNKDSLSVGAGPSKVLMKRRPKRSISTALAVADSNDVGAGPSNVVVKRGRGRPKGSKTSNKGSLGVASGTSNVPVKRPSGRERGLNAPVRILNYKERLALSPPRYTKTPISKQDQETGNGDLVSSLLMRLDAVRRRFSQLWKGKGDFTAAKDAFKQVELYTNRTKRVGHVPGVNIGDIFYHRGEMSLVGLHVAPVAFELLGVKEGDHIPLVVCIVSSGIDADKGHDPRTLVATGFGGTEIYGGGPSDQVLKRMNQNLEETKNAKSPVRVVRSRKDERKPRSTIYIYDGLYLITDMWLDKGKTGFKVFKFRFTRAIDQKPGFENWKNVEHWKENGSVTRPGLVIEDLSVGAERLAVVVVNEVDEEKGPEFFTYVTSLNHMKLNIPPMVNCCKNCTRTCSRTCLCVGRNTNGPPYVDDGLLVTRGPSLVHECGGSCRCSSKCKNKMIQTGVKFSFEVFKTMTCGWGLRSWDPIRAGSFICEFAGEMKQKGDEEEEDFVFDSSRVYKPFEWNYEPELVGEDAREKVDETGSYQLPFVISAKRLGNVARFMNHSCAPNVFWQAINREQDGVWCTHVGFFAMKHIPPLTELTYDYGVSGECGKKKCLCRSEKCSGSFG